MRILVDMNLSPRWLLQLAQAGFEAVAWASIGPVDAADVQIMNHAAKNDFVVLTHDLDFGAILAATHGERPSVVQIRAEDVSPEAIGPQVVAALRQMEAEISVGALLSVDVNRTRLRVLPLRGKT